MESLDLFKMQDHLHIRGEYCVLTFQPYSRIGSPPHTWRIPIVRRAMLKHSGDHLHIRGEYSNLAITSLVV